jgi:putative chitinase
MNSTQLAKILGSSPELVHKWIIPINETSAEYEINTPKRLAAFIAQCAHESSKFTRMEENLNYSAKGLLATFSLYFTGETAARYERKPEMIANRVYANRMDNGPEESGDGWKYRGRGLIQLTGRRNYLAAGLDFGVDFLAFPFLLVEPKYATRTAGWFWKVNKLNALADADDFTMITRKINGGLAGQAERVLLWELAKETLEVK